ncbi:hypothetical protein ILYODFUR_001723 [Ilyodon furcidens]|uniref:Uncharacterized protein n=1 Tax=Ilyodon furcidens TaxID=33524 RepID=A0ABV0V251_9TELE
MFMFLPTQSGGRLTVQSLLKKLCKHTNKNIVWKDKLVERGAQATGITTPLIGLWFKAYFGKIKAQCAAGVIASKPIAYMGCNCPIPCVKPLLKHRHCQKHLTWAKEKKD